MSLSYSVREMIMNNEVLVNWLAQTVAGTRPACSAHVIVGDNGRHKSFQDYRIILAYEDENGESGVVIVTQSEWQAALIKACSQ